jgi:Lysyl-tRNA synthetase (class II)
MAIDNAKLESIEALRKAGIEPYPYSYHVTTHAKEIKDNFSEFEGKEVSIAGRAMQLRQMGGITFIDVQDRSGKIQSLIRNNDLDQKSLIVLANASIGDTLGVRGIVMKSKRGEMSVGARELTMLSKTLRTLPNKWQGLTDTEARYRSRHVDLMMNQEVLRTFEIRAKFMRHVRDILDSRGGIEVETPILQDLYGGASAKPFTTTYHTLDDKQMFLRISDELYLKRLIIGGAERVYEVSKDFRNEDADSVHNPEFTQIEYYEAYSDYETFMKMMEDMLSSFVLKTFGNLKIDYQGETIDFTPPFARMYWVDELKNISGIDVSSISDEDLKRINEAEKLGLKHPDRYHVADSLFDKYLKGKTLQPTFVLDFPTYMCPLTKAKRGNSMLAERFELYVARMEVANSYSELTDPLYQRKMFEEQERERKKGDDEAPPFDEEFLSAIEYGMPPTAGIGISIDRPAMVFTNQTSIKEVILFPPMKSIPLDEDSSGKK